MKSIDIMNEFLLCRFVFNFLEIKINIGNFKIIWLLKLILFYYFLRVIVIKLGNWLNVCVNL